MMRMAEKVLFGPATACHVSKRQWGLQAGESGGAQGKIVAQQWVVVGSGEHASEQTRKQGLAAPLFFFGTGKDTRTPLRYAPSWSCVWQSPASAWLELCHGSSARPAQARHSSPRQ